MSDDEKEGVVELLADVPTTVVADDLTPTPVVPPLINVETVAALSNMAMELVAAGNTLAEDAHNIGQGYAKYDRELIRLKLKQLRGKLRELAETLT